MIRIFTTVILAAFVLYGAYWFVGKSSKEAGIESWLSERADAGWIAESDVNLRGFPNRYDAVLRDLNLADPNSGWAWRAPEFELIQLTYKPNHFIALWPETQIISSPEQKIDVTSDELRASVIFEPRSDFTLDRATLTSNAIDLKSTQNWGLSADDLVLAIRQAETGETDYDLAIKAANFSPSTSLLSQIDRTGLMPRSFETFEMNAIASFNEKLSRESFNNGSGDLQNVELQAFNLAWGELLLRAAGDFRVDSEGYPTGRITVRAENWELMLDMAIAGGFVDENLGSTLRSGLGLLARFSGNANTLDAPLTFSGRQTKLGPITLGPAPRLKL